LELVMRFGFYAMQFEFTPKAFANLSQGFERSENPGAKLK